MVRKLVLLAVAVSTVLAAIPVLAATRPTDIATTSYQDSESESSSSVVGLPGILGAQSVSAVSGQLAPGQRYTGDGFALEVQNIDISTSLVREGYLEVRIGVAYQNNGMSPIPYSATAFAGEYDYPELQMIDDEGVVYPLDRTIADHAVAGSDLPSIPVGLPGHWTVGYQVPETQASDLAIELVKDGSVVATWDLDADSVSLQGWAAPEGATVVGVTEDIAWSDGLVVDFHTTYGDACGDPYSVVSAGNAKVIGTVTSSAVTDTLFPNVQYPTIPFYAIWKDGSSAHYQNILDADYLYLDLADVITGDASKFQPGIETNNTIFDATVNNVESSEKVIMPPGSEHIFDLEFGLPRDSRLVDPQANPAAMYTITPDGTTYWVDLSGAADLDAEFLFGDSFDFNKINSAQRQLLEDLTEAFACTESVPVRYLGTLDGLADYRVITGIKFPAETTLDVTGTDATTPLP